VTAMNSTCPSCGTVYRVDPAKVPTAGVRARCVKCESVFRVRKHEIATADVGAAAPAPAATAPAAEPAVPVLPVPRSAPSAPPAPPPAFGVADPQSKARRLARALISDIVVYHPERREQSVRNGTLREEFRDEIRKSWDEYVAQVGDSLARSTPYFRDALNDILAGGERIF